jgi:LysM repeat protein
VDKFNAFMQRKVFGIKVLYIVAVLVVLLGFVAWKMKSAGPPADQIEDTGETDTAGDTGTTLFPDADGTGTVSSGGTGGTVPDTGTGTGTDTGGGTGTSTGGDGGFVEPETNDSWARKAILFLTQNGSTVQTASSAIQKYLAGDQLSYAEGVLRDKAVGKYGLPPDLPPLGGTATKPTTATKVTKHVPPAVHKVTGAGDNTYGEIAKLYYGSSADQWVDLLQANNKSLGHAAPAGGFKKGTNVWVPPKTNPRYYTATKSVRTLAQIAAKNGITQYQLKELNDKTHFPVAAGKKVRVA